MIRELIAPIALLGLIASMILPLPTTVLDFLLVGNLLFALCLMLSAFFIVEPTKLSALPTLLLLATLCRLSLNIGTTRLILSNGDGGRVIEAFGKVVIGNNLVVGLVVFLVITLVQFIVIAKGSERVAEVAARFTLDALPGKQMSIDADVRAGLLNFEMAREKRQDLQTESRFYGALDGAMKFVKGDAIAGIVITAINILGGFAVGLFMMDLGIQGSVSKFTILSVGDGLISQIPALLNSIAAGMVITRVTRGDGKSLAFEIWNQLGQVTLVTVLLGIASLILSVVPGMPTLPFLAIGVFLLARGAIGLLQDSKAAASPAPVKFNPAVPALVRIDFSADLAQELYQSGKLPDRLEQLRQSIFDRYGLILSLPELMVDRSLVGQSFRLRMRGVVASEIIVRAKDREAFNQIEQQILDLVGRRTAECIDDILTRRTLDHFEKNAPELVAAVVPGIVSVTQVSDVLKNLSSEGLSIQSFDVILQALAEYGPKSSSERQLLEEVRIAMRRLISATFADSQGQLQIITIDPELDLRLAQSERRGQPIHLPSIDWLSHKLEQLENKVAAIVVSRASRRIIRECLDARGQRRVVLAHEELSDDLKLISVAHLEGLHEDDFVEAEQLAA